MADLNLLVALDVLLTEGSVARAAVRLKLSRVLWMPVEYRAELPLAARRFGVAQLWSPSHEQENVLRAERDTVVKKINAKEGDSLAVDAVIIEFA